MELLLSKNPLLTALDKKYVDSYIGDYFNEATQINIATGFISNESIAELRRLVSFRENSLNVSLFIGMNYLDGFTKLQYNAVRDLGSFLRDENLGRVLVSPRAMYHGKMYSFMKEDNCLASFVGLSNLGSFIATSRNLIESDICLHAEEGLFVNDKIKEISRILGQSILEVAEPTRFNEPKVGLLDGYENVEKLPKEQRDRYFSAKTDIVVKIPLKTEPKSNLNTYFGAGKIKGKFSRRDYYEVEIIINKNTPNNKLLPEECCVITEEGGYKFLCGRQGDYLKNFRSQSDLKILGRFIKGLMENAGALEIGKPVTEETLQLFGKRYMVLTKTSIDNCWILSLE